MDPNQDGFVSATNGGFSTDGEYVGEFELTMFGIPQLGGDVTGDNTGNSCGITDLIPDNEGRSVYAVRDGDNLIFRFRVGDDNSSVESWSILLDTDGLFGADDPNSTADNPGFEIDITLIKRNNAGVYVYDIDGIDNCPSPLFSYPISTHFQIAIADEVTCGDPDFFYDFFVPFAPLGVELTTGLRFVAVSNVSATCAMSGNIADVSGVDNNDPEYDGCVECAFNDLVGNQCPTPIIDLCQTCGGFQKDKVNKPTIDVPVRAGQSIISGTSDFEIYIVVEIYPRIGGTDALPIWSATPREIKGNYAVGTIWAVTLTTPLQAYDKIVAKAQKNENSVPCGSAGGNLASVEVTVVQPNTPPSAQNQTVNVTEDIPANIVLTGTDPENDPLTYTIATPPIHGVLNGTGPNLTYAPNLNYDGSDNFTFQVSDGIFNSVLPGTVTINFTPVNDAPVAVNDITTTPEDILLNGNVLTNDSDVEGNTLTVTQFVINSITYPAGNTASIAGTGTLLIIGNGSFTFTPALNSNGPVPLATYTIGDGTLIASATLTITITPVNDAPIANNHSISTAEDTGASITMSGSDVEGSALTYAIVTPPTNGSLSVVVGAGVTYTPNANYSGPDSFTYTVNDGVLTSVAATVSITVEPVNDAPVANNQGVTVQEDVAKAITLTGSDADGNPLTYTIVTPPAHGSLSVVIGADVTYTPNANYNGSDIFTFKVNDGASDSSPATVSITVDPVNDAPVANNQSVSTQMNVARAITLTGSDVEGSSLTYSIVTPPTNGSLSVVVGDGVTYTPNGGYTGSDSFTYTVNDGALTSVAATVSITVIAGINTTPVANNQGVTVQEDVAKAITLTGNDADGNPLTFTIVTPPAQGSLSVVIGAGVTYTPNANYSGSDSFTFKVNDGASDSNPATVSITVDPVNDAPVANNQSVTTSEDVGKAITLTGSDLEGSSLTYAIVIPPTNGNLSVVVGAGVTYTPNANYSGPDSFTFTVNDGAITSVAATVSITVSALNDAPIANIQSVTTSEDVAKAITLTGSDVEGSSLTYAIVTPPAHGSLSAVVGASVTYTPNANFNGSDNFTFKTNDGLIDSNIATVSITITPVGDSPVAFDQNATPLTTAENVAKSITLEATDPDGDAITFIIVTNPAHGVLSGTGANLIYTPVADYNGSDSFTFKANDGTTDSNIATVVITVTPESDAPVAVSQNVTTDEDVPKNILLTATDADGDPLTYSVLTQPTNGILTGTGTNLMYTPALNFYGFDSFSFNANDGSTDSNLATISIEVISVNDPPVITSLPVLYTMEDSLLQVCLNVIDPEGDEIIFSAPSNTSGGGSMVRDVAPFDFCYIFTPDVNFNGESIWDMQVSDIHGLDGKASVTIIVGPVNDAPILTNITATTEINIPVIGTLFRSDDMDPEGTELSVDLIPKSEPSNGVILINADGSYTYTPDLNFFGQDEVIIQMCDSGIPLPGACASKVLTINVTTINTLPPSTLFLSTPEDTLISFCYEYSDPEGNNIILGSTTNISGGGTLNITSGADLCFQFSPALNFNGISEWEIEICDNGTPGLCTKLKVIIDITPVNDPPVAVRDSIRVLRKVLQDGNVLINDYDIEDDELSVTTTPIKSVDHGELILNSDGEFTYISDKTFRGIDSLIYEVCDNGITEGCSTATLVINVEDLPFKVYEGITPNGDGTNDYLRIEGIDFYPNCMVRIFDRYNNLVFEMSGYNNEERIWRGVANKGIGNQELQEGTYFYTITLGDGSAPASGFVALKRD
ncbi:MAG: Ig-like domain-containing protein [Bacteroidota bacterium]